MLGAGSLTLDEYHGVTLFSMNKSMSSLMAASILRLMTTPCRDGIDVSDSHRIL